MKKKSLVLSVLLAVIIFGSALVLAEVVNKPVDVDFNNLASQIEPLNKEFQGTVLEGPIGKLFGNERINIYVKLENGQEQVISLITEDKKVKSIALGENEDPTFTVQTSEAIIKETLSDKNPELALKKYLKEKKINYQARGFFKKIKLAFVSMFVKFDTEEETESTETKTEDQKEVEKKTESKEEVKPEEKKEEIKEEVKEKTEIKENKTEAKTEVKAEPTGPKTYGVKINPTGFDPLELKIKANDKVEWTVIRNGNLKLAMVLGTQECSAIKSPMLKTNEKFSWIFTKPMKCTIVDGVTTTQIGKIIVE